MKMKRIAFLSLLFFIKICGYACLGVAIYSGINGEFSKATYFLLLAIVASADVDIRLT